MFVAHNVRFDHGFVVNELQRLDKRLKAKTLCTVRLSRKLYPQHKSHGLDAIMQRHGLHTQARHRAMGDVDMVLAWLRQAQAELGARRRAPRGRGPAARQRQRAAAAGNLDLRHSRDTPACTCFYGEGPLPLYIGKSVNSASAGDVALSISHQGGARDAHPARNAPGGVARDGG